MDEQLGKYLTTERIVKCLTDICGVLSHNVEGRIITWSGPVRMVDLLDMFIDEMKIEQSKKEPLDSFLDGFILGTELANKVMNESAKDSKEFRMFN